MIGIVCFLAFFIGPDDSLQKVIRAQNAKVIDALITGDAQAYADMFVDDGFVMTPGTPTIRGQKNILNSRRDVLSKVKVLDARLDTISIEQKGAIAWEIGRFYYELKAEKGEKRSISGKYLVIWEQQSNGSWKIRGDVGLPDP